MFERFISFLAHSSRPSRGRGVKLLFIFLIFLLPVVLLAFYNYAQTSRTMTDSLIFRARSVTAIPMAAALKERLDRIVDIGTSFSIHPKIREAVLAGNWKQTVEILKLFKTLTDEAFIDRVFVADAGGILKAGFPETGTEEQNFSYRDWYQGVVHSSGPYVSEVYKRAVEPQYNVTTIAIPIKDEKGALAAILALQTKIDHLLNWARTLEAAPGQIIYIVDQKGKLIAHPRFDPQENIIDASETPSVQNVLAGKDGVEIGFSRIENKETVSIYAPVSVYSWGVVVEEPAATFFASRDSSLKRLLAVYGVAALFFVFLFYVVIKTIDYLRDHLDPEALR